MTALLLRVQVVAVVAMVGVQLMRRAAAPAVLDAFDDPVSRGVYGPWHPVIRSNANQAFLRWALVSEGERALRHCVSLTACKGTCSHAIDRRMPPCARSWLASWLTVTAVA